MAENGYQRHTLKLSLSLSVGISPSSSTSKSQPQNSEGHAGSDTEAIEAETILLQFI
jgi:hypothetical protein